MKVQLWYECYWKLKLISQDGQWKFGAVIQFTVLQLQLLKTHTCIVVLQRYFSFHKCINIPLKLMFSSYLIFHCSSYCTFCSWIWYSIVEFILCTLLLWYFIKISRNYNTFHKYLLCSYRNYRTLLDSKHKKIKSMEFYL